MTEQLGDQKAAVGTASRNRAPKNSGSTDAGSKNSGSTDAGSRNGGSTDAGSKNVGSVSGAPSGRTSANPTSASPTSNVDPTSRTAAPGLQARHAVLRYTTLRLVLFLVALLVVWGVAVVFNMDLSSQLSKLTLLAVSLLLSSAASFVLLSKYRDEMSAGIVARTQRLSKKFDDAASFEDEDE